MQRDQNRINDSDKVASERWNYIAGTVNGERAAGESLDFFVLRDNNLFCVLYQYKSCIREERFCAANFFCSS